MLNAVPKPSPFLEVGILAKSKEDEDFHKKYFEVEARVANWEAIFNELVCRFTRCQSIFYGSDAIVKMLNTKVQMFNPILKEVVDELLSYLKSNPRSVTVDIPQFKIFKDLINEIIGSIMIEGDVYNKIVKGFKDYLIYGISILKMNPSNDHVLRMENVDVSTCIWDTQCDYKNFRPSFFIREYIANNFDTSNKYGEEFVRIRKKPDIIFRRLNKSARSILENVTNKAISEKQVTVEYNDDIFSNEGKTVSKEKVDDGLSQILEYYCLVNRKNTRTKKVYKYYERYIFVNGQLADHNSNIEIDEFPYITMANYRHDSALVADMFDSKVNDAMSEVMQLNIIENSHCDAILASANGTLIINKASFTNKDATMKKIKSDIVLINGVNEAGVGNSVMNLPPARVDQSTIIQSKEMQNRIRKKFGLLTFDPNQATAKSGYHEALRLDRESQSINNIITPLDAALNIIGKRLVSFIKTYSKTGIDTLLKLTKNPDAEQIISDFSNIDEYIHVTVAESRESANNSMKKFNQLQSLSDLMGVPLQLPPEVLADALNLSEEVVEIFKQYNTPQVDELKDAEVKEKEASAIDKIASAKKKIAESKAISGSRESSKME